MGPKAAKATKEPGFPWKQNVELERLLFHEVYNILQNKKQSMGTKTAMYERATSNLRALALAREHGKHIADSDGKPAPVDRLTAEVVRQKIGTASKQARKLYSKLKYKDKTGAPCNAKEYANYMDVDKAVDRWRNFAVWVEYFFDHPTWGFGAADDVGLRHRRGQGDGSSDSEESGDLDEDDLEPLSDDQAVGSFDAGRAAQAAAFLDTPHPGQKRSHGAAATHGGTSSSQRRGLSSHVHSSGPGSSAVAPAAAAAGGGVGDTATSPAKHLAELIGDSSEEGAAVEDEEEEYVLSVDEDEDADELVELPRKKGKVAAPAGSKRGGSSSKGASGHGDQQAHRGAAAAAAAAAAVPAAAAPAAGAAAHAPRTSHTMHSYLLSMREIMEENRQKKVSDALEAQERDHAHDARMQQQSLDAIGSMLQQQGAIMTQAFGMLLTNMQNIMTAGQPGSGQPGAAANQLGNKPAAGVGAAASRRDPTAPFQPPFQPPGPRPN